MSCLVARFVPFSHIITEDLNISSSFNTCMISKMVVSAKRIHSATYYRGVLSCKGMSCWVFG